VVLLVAPGDTVESGDPLVIFEEMKIGAPDRGPRRRPRSPGWRHDRRAGRDRPRPPMSLTAPSVGGGGAPAAV